MSIIAYNFKKLDLFCLGFVQERLHGSVLRSFNFQPKVPNCMNQQLVKDTFFGTQLSKITLIISLISFSDIVMSHHCHSDIWWCLCWFSFETGITGMSVSVRYCWDLRCNQVVWTVGYPTTKNRTRYFRIKTLCKEIYYKINYIWYK